MVFENLDNTLKSARRIARKALLTSIVVASPVIVGDVQAQQETTNYVFLSVGGSVGYRPHNIFLSDTPESIRDVPAHPQDYVFVREGIIPEERLTHPSGLNGQLIASTGFGTKSGRLDMRFGAYGFVRGVLEKGFDVEPSDQDAIRRRGYLGSRAGTEERGVGTALTYYRLTSTLRDDRRNRNKREEYKEFGLFARVGFEIDEGVNFSTDFYVEYEHALTSSSLMIETGWDRFNALEARTRFELAEVRNRNVKVGLNFDARPDDDNEIWSIKVFGGYSFPDVNRSSIGRQVDLVFENHAFVGLSIGKKLER